MGCACLCGLGFSERTSYVLNSVNIEYLSKFKEFVESIHSSI